MVAAGETCHEFVMTIEKHFIAYRRYREAMKLFRFLLSSFTFIMICSKYRTALFVNWRRSGHSN